MAQESESDAETSAAVSAEFESIMQAYEDHELQRKHTAEQYSEWVNTIQGEIKERQRAREAASNAAMAAEEQLTRLAEQHAEVVGECAMLEDMAVQTAHELQQKASEDLDERQKTIEAQRQERLRAKAVSIREQQEMAERVASLVLKSRREAEANTALAVATEAKQVQVEC